jgi:predicted N-formylglutamate amidohydrolase
MECFIQLKHLRSSCGGNKLVHFFPEKTCPATPPVAYWGTTMIPVIFSCEHATCAVPEAYKEMLSSDQERITSPEGWDLGALNLAQALAMKFRTPLVHGEITRLIIDCYLQEGNEGRWSECSMKLTDAQREKLHERQFVPHLSSLRQRIANELERSSSVLHISVHTFDPQLHPNLHVSLLYSEGRVGESTLALNWLRAMQERLPGMNISGNQVFYPEPCARNDPQRNIRASSCK